ncbi:MAG TPA: outer membrane beta-barrel protein [Candidatus Bathyarchaeia archaeon]|nr:outer membrane beta-barrel protein [Candidatus Bathyarchaeia archaeon]
MKKSLVLIAVALMCTMTAFAQDVPKFEVAGGYSYVNFHPGLSQITSQNFNGGGGAFVYNITPLIGIKADFMGYAVGTGWTKKLIDAGYPVTGSASGNMFTYMFGPQFKLHTGRYQPFAEALFGAAHSNGYGTALYCISGNDSASCNLKNGNGNNNAFAMAYGGGLDIKMSNRIQLRPVEVDYLYTNFSSNHVAHISNSQNSFRYFAGVNFTFGGK